MNCPNCDGRMEMQTFAGHYGKPIVLDLCSPCHAIWFDGSENLQLTAGSTLDLLKIIREKQAIQSKAPEKALACPRCRAKLEHTNDMLLNTRFSYERCPRNHGRFITFFQFLREKSFVRDLSAKEIAELKQRIQMLHCSNCGAVIDLAKESGCSYCGSPISMLDPQQMEKTVQQLQKKAAQQSPSSASGSSVKDKLEVGRLPDGRSSSPGSGRGSNRRQSDDDDQVSFFDLVRCGIEIMTDGDNSSD